MYQTSTNITPKYRQETRYNYIKNSGFERYPGSLHSPLLYYHYVSTSLTMQIPAETLSQTHRVCFIRKERDSETGFSYFGARYYDSDILTGWLSVDPLADKYPGLSPYAYCGWNPVRLVDPDGEKPRKPYFIRVATSKNVYNAIGYKLRHGGKLDVWEHNSGSILASVQSSNVNVDGFPVIQAKMFMPDGYLPYGEIKETTDFFVNAEIWMDEPTTDFDDFTIKTTVKMLYSTINDPFILFTGQTLAGTEVTQSEREDAFAGFASSIFGGITKGMGLIRTSGKTGLDKYNDFVKKMGNYQGRSKKEMGILYQKNKELNKAVSTNKSMDKCLSIGSQFKEED
ncbi:MAG: RHS repeat-associated core domain-containing protein [Bacteroidales bacterium]|nr:RHS repeat-associated core domain-containing protein [Bacteroidales bacterium]